MRERLTGAPLQLLLSFLMLASVHIICGCERNEGAGDRHSQFPWDRDPDGPGPFSAVSPPTPPVVELGARSDSWNPTIVPVPPDCVRRVEVCDGRDNSCDGIVDGTRDGPLRRMCYDGPLETLKIGECIGGIQTCTFGQWGPCIGQVLPRPEICDGLDNNCDGQTDVDTVDSGGPCGPDTDLGQCRFGVLECIEGSLACNGAIYPEPEVCDGTDNNCNGIVDDGCECVVGTTGQCGSSVGACISGVRTCLEGGVWGECIGAIGPEPEVCDGTDNDCNGVVDDNTDEWCYPGDPQDLVHGGICRAGTRVCRDGVLGGCEGYVLPRPEQCNGLDDSCNGIVDDGFLNPGLVDVVLAIDISGSMTPYIRAAAEASASLTAIYGESPTFRFALLSFPSAPPFQDTIVNADFGDMVHLSYHLGQMNADGGWQENSLDVIAEVADPSNPLELSWRPGSVRALIMFTDEPEQSYRTPPLSLEEAGRMAGDNDLHLYLLISANPYWAGRWTNIYDYADGLWFHLANIADDMEHRLESIFGDICPTAPTH